MPSLRETSDPGPQPSPGPSGTIPPRVAGPVLVVAAVPEEVRRIVQYVNNFRHGRLTLEDLRDQSRRGSIWPVISVIPDRLDIAVSGIGRANAAGAVVFAMLKAAQPYRTVLNLGVAGALPRSEATIGDVVIADASIFVEEGISLPDGSKGDMRALGFELIPLPFADGNSIFPDGPLCDDLSEILAPDDSVIRGAIATVACCSGTDSAADAVVRQTAATAEAMEGAAVLLASHRMGCHHCAEVRIISNTCGDRSTQQWDLSAALSRLESVMDALVQAAGR